MLSDGEVAERFMAAVLKTVDRKVRGFESLPLRHLPLRHYFPAEAVIP